VDNPEPSRQEMVEGATTRAEARRAQVGSKRLAPLVGDDIVCSSWQHEEVVRKRGHRNTRNSTYGSLLSPHFRFGRKEMGASVTACGRQITTHMMQTIHLHLEPGNPQDIRKTTSIDDDGTVHHVYAIDSDTVIYGDTDSVDKDTVVSTSLGTVTIEQLFNQAPMKWSHNGKEFAQYDNLYSPCIDGEDIVNKPVKAIYRHKVSKPRWKITLQDGKTVVVTGDHSIMVMRNGELVEVRAEEINRDTDFCISIKSPQ
jgi:hypothetical protein